MPRYMVQRTFPGGLHIPIDDNGAETVAKVVGVNADEGVTWVHSYVSDDKTKTFCVYDGPIARGDPLRRRAQRSAGRPDHRRIRAQPVLLQVR